MEPDFVVLPGAYTTRVVWAHIGDDTTTPLVTHHGSIEDAEIDGFYKSCLGGARLVEVYSPDGDVMSVWDPTADGVANDAQTPLSKVWQRLHVPEDHTWRHVLVSLAEVAEFEKTLRG